MEFEPKLYEREATERLEQEILDRAKLVMETDESGALGMLYQLLAGYAEHLARGLELVDYPKYEASLHGWHTAWSKLRNVLGEETLYVPEIASYLDRNMGTLNHEMEISDGGEALDPISRSFYRVFIDRLEHPSVHPTALWLHEEN